MAHELTDWYEEAERLRAERDALTARVVERDAQIAALRAEREMLLGNVREGVRALCEAYDAQTATYYPRPTSFAELEALTALRERIAALATEPAPPTAAPLAAAEREVIGEAVNVVLAWERLGKCEDEFADYLHDGACREWGDALDGAILRLKGTISLDAVPAPLTAAERDALQWYADPQNWTPIIAAETEVAGLKIVASGCLADKDCGQRARDALRAARGEVGDGRTK